MTALRLAAWREWRGRGPLHALAPLLTLACWLAPEDEREAWVALALGLAVPIASVLAWRGRADADAFWRGMGGPGWCRLSGAAAVHGPPFALSVAALWSMAPASQPEVALVASVYGSTLAARSLTGSLYVLAGPMLAAAWCIGAISLGGALDLPSDWRPLAWWTPGLVGMALAVAWEDRLGPWAAAVRRPYSAIASALGGIALATVAFTLLLSIATGERRVNYLGERDGRLITATWHTSPVLSPASRLRSAIRDGARRVGPRGASYASVGPSGSITFFGPDWAELQVGDRVLARCPTSAFVVAWRADGRAALARGEEGLTTIDANGCSLRRGAYAGAWLGDVPVWAAGDVVYVGEQEVGRPGPEVSLHAARGTLFVQVDRGPLYVLEAGRLRLLAEDTSWRYRVAGGHCARIDGRPRCWRAGSLEVVDHPEESLPVDVDLAWLSAERVVLDLRTGERRAFPAEAREAPQRPRLLDDGTLRWATPELVVDLRPDGTVGTRPLR